MARTPAQRGPFGRWLTHVRSERYERQVDALEAMRKLAGLHISQAEYSQWESGSRVPRPDNPKVERLYEFFGSRPEEETASAVGEAGLIAALDRQTQKIEELVEVLTVLARSRITEQSLLESLPDALARSLAAMREDDPADEPRVAAPRAAK